MSAIKDKKTHSWKTMILPFFGLFFSLGTLFCCALPALLISLGLGAVLASLIASAPWITFFSEKKILVFTIAGIALIISGISIYSSKNLACPLEPKMKHACQKTRKISYVFFLLSLIIFLIGVFFAFFIKYFI